MQRQSLLTNNLVNADTPGFQPQDINFQQTLGQALQNGTPLSQVTYREFTSTQVNGPDGNGVSPEQTNAQIAENGLLYQELVGVAQAREHMYQTAINPAA